MKQVLGLLPAVIAAAVVSFALPGRTLPDTANAPAAQASLQIEPISLNVVMFLPVHFEAKDGLLTLKDPFMGISFGTRPPDRILWSDQFTDGSRQFTLAATDSDESLQDEQGTTIWEKHFEKPDLTLAVDDKHNAILRDQQGAQLWAGHLPLSFRASIAAAQSSLPIGMLNYTTNYFQYLYTKQSAELRDADGNLLWSGNPPHNTGLLIMDATVLRLVGLERQDQLPLNKTFHLEFTTAPLTVTFADQQRHVIDTRQVMSLTLNVSSKDIDPHDALGLFRYGFYDDGRQRVPEVAPTVPGIYYADYHNVQGDLVQSEMIHVIDTRQKHSYDEGFENMRQVWRAYFDKSGRRVSTEQTMERPL